ncbi:MAG: hypothetical protein HWE18_00640 [Gammaproteobacteria bacterium]|nr:hypothetical protein [Gammaproteobacteria bacterium]
MQSIISLTKLPSLFNLYLGSLLKRKPRIQPTATASTTPTLKISTQINTRQLTQYTSLCGVDSNQTSIPIFYPQVMAFKLHLLLLLNKSLPFPVMGLVHKSNDVTYLKAIKPTDPLEIKVGLESLEKQENGTDCHIFTHVYVNGELHWTAISTYFYRAPKNNNQQSQKNKSASTLKPQLTPYSNKALWQLPRNLGRKYAFITGDLNPIHLSSLTAKLFGFKKTIIHGMFLAAKVANEILPKEAVFPSRIDLQFKRPVFLPNQVEFRHSNTRFQLYPILDSKDQNTPMLLGKVEYHNKPDTQLAPKNQTN